MKFEKYLNEEYFALFVNKSGQAFEIYTDPSRQEVRDAAKDSCEYKIRFIADKGTKRFYAWSANVMHENVAPMLGYSGTTYYREPNLMAATGEVQPDGRIKYRSTIQSGIYKYEPKEWEWTNKYFTSLDNIVTKIKSEIEDIEYQKNLGKKYRNVRFNESFFKYCSAPGVSSQPFPVYTNPTPSDLLEIKRDSGQGKTVEIRFIIDTKTHDVFIWDSYEGVHGFVFDMLNLPLNRCISGLGDIWQTKVIVKSGEFFNYAKIPWEEIRYYQQRFDFGRVKDLFK